MTSTPEIYTSPKEEIHKAIYEKLQKIIPDLEAHLIQGTRHGKSSLGSSGMMDLSFDYLGTDENSNAIIALSHYYQQNGDLVPDPDMEIRVLPKEKLAEALTYQDQYIYQRVYDEYNGEPFIHLKRKGELNIFLNQWLSNCIEQGHHIDLGRIKKKVVEHPAPEKEDHKAKQLEAINEKNNSRERNNGALGR